MKLFLLFRWIHSDRHQCLFAYGRVHGQGCDLGNPSFTPAVIAGIQAAEAVKVLLGYEDVLQRKMLFVDLFTGNVHKVEL